MPLIKVSLKGLAKFMTASPASQRKIVRDFKYPDPEGVAQAAYYRDARDRIAAYHQNNHPADWLSSRADALTTRAASSTGRSATRLRNNARALRQYEAGWGDNRLEVLADLKLELTYGGVRISVVPDLHVMERGIKKIIKFKTSHARSLGQAGPAEREGSGPSRQASPPRSEIPSQDARA